MLFSLWDLPLNRTTVLWAYQDACRSLTPWTILSNWREFTGSHLNPLKGLKGVATRIFIWCFLPDCILRVTILALGLCANFKVIYQLEMSDSCKFQPFNSCSFSVLIFHFTSVVTWETEIYLINLQVEQRSFETKHASRKNIYVTFVKFYVWVCVCVYGIYLVYLNFTFIFITVSLYSFT